MITLIFIWLILGIHLFAISGAAMHHGSRGHSKYHASGAIGALIGLGIYWGAGWFSQMGAAQYLVLLVVGLLVIESLLLHGKERLVQVNFFQRVQISAIWMVVYYYGGLFARLGLAP